MEAERRGKDSAWLISHPREMCKHCSEWNECSGEPWDDMSGCAARDVVESHNYLKGLTESCREFFEY